MIKQLACDGFWQNIHKSARSSRRPLRVMFELTYRCNFICRHCYVPKTWRRKEDLSTAGVLDIIRQLKAAGCFYLGFTGGEIFTRPDIYKIIEFSRKQGMQVILYTNGSLIDKPAAKRIAAIGVNKVDITLPARNQAVFEAITAVPGSHKAVFTAIEYLQKYKVALGFKTCLVKANQGEIEAIKSFCARLGCQHRFDDSTSPRIDQLMSKQAKSSSGFKCGATITQCAITPQGEVKLCPMVAWPGIKISSRQSFSRIWKSLPEMLKAEKCRVACPCGLSIEGARDASCNKI
jgi:MoaA/NifB/PqqE/SkfB family radical SAM enzyme